MSKESPRKRPISKGPKKRVGSNNGNGTRTPYKRGENSHDGTVFRRGPDQIPRGSGLLMLRTIFLDRREEIYDNLSALVKTSRGAHAFVMDFIDRTEGKAKQAIERNVRRVTNFAPAPSEPPSSLSGTDTDAAAHTVGPDGERMIQL